MAWAEATIGRMVHYMMGFRIPPLASDTDRSRTCKLLHVRANSENDIDPYQDGLKTVIMQAVNGDPPQRSFLIPARVSPMATV